ncbi:MAG: DUF418 domain-containing protein [Deinococcales bacterium]
MSWAFSYWQGMANHLAEGFILIFAEGAFYSIFSFLFSLGFALQLLRAEAKGDDLMPRFRRRLAILLAFGLIHVFMIWLGDILTQYALVGFLLPFFSRKNLKDLWRYVILLSLVSFVLNLGLGWLTQMAPNAEGEDFADSQRFSMVEQLKTYATGSYSDIFQDRFPQAIVGTLGTFILVPTLLALFLLGLMAGKVRFFELDEEQRNFALRLLPLTLGLALIIKGCYAYLLIRGEPQPLGMLLSQASGGPLLGFSYMAILILLWHRGFKRFLFPLARIGRMALSNYIAQSLICTTIFYGYGLGFYGKLGPAVTLWLSFTIYLVQVLLSHFWLNRYRFGPLEWLWRSLTYGSWQKL